MSDLAANSAAFVQIIKQDLAGGITDDLLAARAQTHGSFADNARISQQLKDYVRLQAGYVDLTDIQREAIDNLSIKLARILSGGGGNFNPDNFDDIAGYAELAAREIRGQ